MHSQLILFLSYCSRPMCPPAIRWRPPVPILTVAATAVGEGNSWVKLTCTSAASIRGPQTKTWSSSANREWFANSSFLINLTSWVSFIKAVWHFGKHAYLHSCRCYIKRSISLSCHVRLWWLDHKQFQAQVWMHPTHCILDLIFQTSFRGGLGHIEGLPLILHPCLSDSLKDKHTFCCCSYSG